jgi:hypothetical protein
MAAFEGCMQHVALVTYLYIKTNRDIADISSSRLQDAPHSTPRHNQAFPVMLILQPSPSLMHTALPPAADRMITQLLQLIVARRSSGQSSARAFASVAQSKQRFANVPTNTAEVHGRLKEYSDVAIPTLPTFMRK